METPTEKVCPHCKLPPVLPEVCTPEINAVLEANIARDTALHNHGYELGKRMAGDAHPTPPPAALAPERWEHCHHQYWDLGYCIDCGISANDPRYGQQLRDRNIAPPPARAEAPEGADEERWRLAGERVGIVYGCDTPDWMAETILGLRAENARLTQALEQRDAVVDQRERAVLREASSASAFRQQFYDAAARAEKAEAERDQQAGALGSLLEALEPFARMADAYDPPEGDDHESAWEKRPTIGQLRHARAALAASAPEKGEPHVR